MRWLPWSERFTLWSAEGGAPALAGVETRTPKVGEGSPSAVERWISGLVPLLPSAAVDSQIGLLQCPVLPTPLPQLRSLVWSLGGRALASRVQLQVRRGRMHPPHLLVLQSSVQQRDESQALPGVYWRSGPTTEEQVGPMPPCPWSQPSGTQGMWLSVVPLHFLLCYLREVRP